MFDKIVSPEGVSTDIKLLTINKVNNIFMGCKDMSEVVKANKLLAGVLFKHLMITKKVTSDIDILARMRAYDDVINIIRETINIDATIVKSALIEYGNSIYCQDLSGCLNNNIFPNIDEMSFDNKAAFIGYVNICLI